MTANVISVRPDTPIREIAEILVRNRISAVPITNDDGRLVGIVSEADLLRRAEIATEPSRSRWSASFRPGSAAAEYVRSHGRSAKHVMTRHPITATEEMPLTEIAAVLERKRVNRLPVVRGNQLVGIVSRADLVSTLARSAHALPADPTSDDAVEREVQARIDTLPWAYGPINVTVRDGVATVSGLVDSHAEREAVRVVAENSAGVRAVQHKLLIRRPLPAF